MRGHSENILYKPPLIITRSYPQPKPIPILIYKNYTKVEIITKKIFSPASSLSDWVMFPNKKFLLKYKLYLREAAKKSYFLNGRAIKRPHPPPSLGLNGSRVFSQKIAKNGFWHFFSSPNFWTKMPILFGKYCNNTIPTDKL